MTNVTEPIALAYQSKQDTVLDRRAAAVARSLKLFGWTGIGFAMLVLVLLATPLGGSYLLPFAGVLAPLGIGSLYLVRAIRREQKSSIIVASIVFVLLWLAFTGLLLYVLASAWKAGFDTETLVVMAVLGAVFLPMDVGLLAMAWGLFGVARALSKKHSILESVEGSQLPHEESLHVSPSQDR